MRPIWKKIYEQELKRIQTRTWQAGDVLATTQSLADANGISYITARRILTELAKTGLVKNVPRVGCVIAEQKPKIYLLSPDQLPGSEKPLILSLLLKGIFEEAMRQHLPLIPVTLENLYHFNETAPVVLIYLFHMNFLDSDALLELLPENIIPCGIHCPRPPARGMGIGSDAEGMMARQVETMIARGCRRISYVGSADTPWFYPRFKSFISSMKNNGRELPLSCILTPPEQHIRNFREWYSSYQPDGICTPGIHFAEDIISRLSEQEKKQTLIGSQGIPAQPTPGYFYLQPDYYSEGTEIIRFIAEADPEKIIRAKQIFKMVSGTLHDNN